MTPIAALALLPLAGLALPSAASIAHPEAVQPDETLIDHRALGSDLLQRFGIEVDGGPASVSTRISLDEIVAEHFVHARFGALDLAMPAELAKDGRAAGRFLDCAVASVRLQARWVELAAGPSKDAKAFAKDVKAIVGWLEKVRGPELATASREAAGKNLTELVAPSAKVAEAVARFDEFVLGGRAFGEAGEVTSPEILLLGPSRRDFHELLGLFGWLAPELQGVYWHDGTVPWTNTYFNAVTVVALEYHSGDGAAGEALAGIDANERNPTAMQQQVTQLAANSLVTHTYGERVPPALVGAMAINLVVDLFGECATRVDGDLRQRRTEAREVFIPGGQSEGGMLPPNFANSRFRGEEGKDRFVVPLSSCQSAGATQARQERKKGKIEHFQLWDDTQSKRLVVTAPLLGSPAAENPPIPEAFHQDAAEFFRAYRTCFLHWLATEGGGSKAKSTKAYAALLVRLAGLESSLELEAAVEDVYGMPLSSKEPGSKDLEGRFLKWLSKQ